MKRRLLLCMMLMAVRSPIASGDALNIAWDTCLGDGGAGIKTSACVANTGTNLLALTYTPSVDIAGFVGLVGSVNIDTEGPLPAWWGNGCAGKTLAQVLGTNAANWTCTNDAYGWLGNALGGTSALRRGWNGSNTAQVEFAYANQIGGEPPMLAGEEWFVANVTISNTKSSGTGACGGCSVPVCVAFAKAIVDRVGFPLPKTVTQGGQQWVVFWQDQSARWACFGTDPTRKSTWGAVKALYR
jgi:hypothetical protein